jgi:hypothetical protein
MDLPLAPFRGSQEGRVLLRVTPESGSATYLVSPFRVPAVPKSKFSGQIRGGFAVGEGKYAVDAIVEDENGQRCRSHWSVLARRSGNEHGLQMAIAPSSVMALSSPAVPTSHASSEPSFEKLTVVVHVDPPSPRMSRLPPNEAMKLLGALSALLEQVRTGSVRLVVMNLEQQKILLRRDGFKATELTGVGKLLNDEHPAMVDYATLRNPKGPMNLLARLLREEFSAAHPADALVFLGARLQIHGSFPSDALKRVSNRPRVFYMKCEMPLTFANALHNSSPFGMSAESANFPTQVGGTLDSDTIESDDRLATFDRRDDSEDNDDEMLAQSDQHDSIERLVRRLKGETIAIRRPADCGRAIQHIALRTSH